MPKWLVVLALGLVLLTLVPPISRATAAPGSNDWLRKEDEFTIVYYKTGKETDAEQALGWMREAREVVSKVLGATLSYKVSVYLYSDLQSWGRGAGDMYADANAKAFYAPTFSAQTDPWMANPIYYEKNFTHELVHLVSAQMRGNSNPPTWFWEGLAEYTAVWGSGKADWIARYSRYDAELAASAADGDITSFTGTDVYARGSEVLRFMFLNFGPDKLHQLIRTDTGSFDQDLQKTLGVTLPQLRKAWYQWVSAEFRVPLSLITGNTADGGVVITSTHYREVEIPLYIPTHTPVLSPVHVQMQLGSREFMVGEVHRTTEVAPFIQDGRAMVPLRAVSEALGADVRYDPSTKAITIDLPKAGSGQSNVDTGETGEYIHLKGDTLIRDPGGLPTLHLVAGAIKPMTASQLMLLVGGTDYATYDIYGSKEQLRKRWSSWTADHFNCLLFVRIPMVAEPGGWRTEGRVILRPSPDAPFQIITQSGEWLNPEWTLTDDPS